MQKQHPEQDSSTEQKSQKQLRFLGFLMLLLGPMMLVIVLTSGAGEVSLGGIDLTPPLSTIAICGLAIACFVTGIVFVRARRS